MTDVIARRRFLTRGVAAGITGAAAGVLANIETLIAAEGSRSGAGFTGYMAHDPVRAKRLVDFMIGRGFVERTEFSVAAQGAHRDIWGRGTLPFDTVQTIMEGPNGFAVLVGDGASTTTPSPPHAQVWRIAGLDLKGSSSRTSAEPSTSEVFVADDAGVREAAG